MSGKELWDFIEREARVAFDVSDNWKMTMVDLRKRDGDVKVELSHGKNRVKGSIHVDPEVFE